MLLILFPFLPPPPHPLSLTPLSPSLPPSLPPPQACAPRWVLNPTLTGDLDQRRPIGRCFYSPRDLQNFTGIQSCSKFDVCVLGGGGGERREGCCIYTCLVPPSWYMKPYCRAMYKVFDLVGHFVLASQGLLGHCTFVMGIMS